MWPVLRFGLMNDQPIGSSSATRWAGVDLKQNALLGPEGEPLGLLLLLVLLLTSPSQRSKQPGGSCQLSQAAGRRVRGQSLIQLQSTVWGIRRPGGEAADQGQTHLLVTQEGKREEGKELDGKDKDERRCEEEAGRREKRSHEEKTRRKEGRGAKDQREQPPCSNDTTADNKDGSIKARASRCPAHTGHTQPPSGRTDATRDCRVRRELAERTT